MEKLKQRLNVLGYINKYEYTWFAEIGKSYRTNFITSYKKDFEDEQELKKETIRLLRTINYIEYQINVIKDFNNDFIENYLSVKKEATVDEVVSLFKILSKTILEKFFDKIDRENCDVLQSYFYSGYCDKENDDYEFKVHEELEKHIEIRDIRIKEIISEYRDYLLNKEDQ
ncbi:MAG: hypothetical protein AB7E37_06730 [Candidatus Altimarinota bacterium]